MTQVGIDERATQTSWPDYWILNLDNLARVFFTILKEPHEMFENYNLASTNFRDFAENDIKIQTFYNHSNCVTET